MLMVSERKESVANLVVPDRALVCKPVSQFMSE